MGNMDRVGLASIAIGVALWFSQFFIKPVPYIASAGAAFFLTLGVLHMLPDGWRPHLVALLLYALGFASIAAGLEYQFGRTPPEPHQITKEDIAEAVAKGISEKQSVPVIEAKAAPEQAESQQRIAAPPAAADPKPFARVRVADVSFEAQPNGELLITPQIKNFGPGIANAPKAGMAAWFFPKMLSEAEIEAKWKPWADSCRRDPPPPRGENEFEEGQVWGFSEVNTNVLRLPKSFSDLVASTPDGFMYVFAYVTYSDPNTPKGKHLVSEYCAFMKKGSFQKNLCPVHNRIYLQEDHHG